MMTIPIARNARVGCYAFEPDLISFANLAENVRWNVPHANATFYRIALHDRPGPVMFASADMNIGDRRIAAAGMRRATIDVPGAMLDEMEITAEEACDGQDRYAGGGAASNCGRARQ